MQQICPRCGAETDGHGSRGLCADCYRDEAELIDLPDELSVARCPHCGRVRRGMDWEEAGADRAVVYHALDDAIDGEEVVAVRFEETGDGYAVTVLVEDTVDGSTLQQELESRIVVEREQCGPCAKFHGGHFRYTLQLRGDHLDDALERMMETAAAATREDREQFVADVAEVHGGYDVFVSTRDLAEQLIKAVEQEYDVDTERSEELVGEEDGQRIYRTTVSVRIT